MPTAAECQRDTVQFKGWRAGKVQAAAVEPNTGLRLGLGPSRFGFSHVVQKSNGVGRPRINLKIANFALLRSSFFFVMTLPARGTFAWTASVMLCFFLTRMCCMCKCVSKSESLEKEETFTSTENGPPGHFLCCKRACRKCCKTSWKKGVRSHYIRALVTIRTVGGSMVLLSGDGLTMNNDIQRLCYAVTKVHRQHPWPTVSFAKFRRQATWTSTYGRPVLLKTSIFSTSLSSEDDPACVAQNVLET